MLNSQKHAIFKHFSSIKQTSLYLLAFLLPTYSIWLDNEGIDYERHILHLLGKMGYR